MTPIERQTAAAGPLDSEMQKHLTNFSLITHGFGGPAMVAALNAFRHYLTAMKSNYEKILTNDMPQGLQQQQQQSSKQSSYSTGSNRASGGYMSSARNPIELSSMKVESKD